MFTPNFQFGTLLEVENYIVNDNTLQFLPPFEAQDGTIVTEFRYTKSFGRQVRILVKQTLCNNGTGQSYQVHQITANLAGSQNFGATWQTNMVNFNVVNDEVVINVYGSLGFGASAFGIPFAYFDNKHFRMKIDIYSGFPVDFIELD